MTITVKSLQTWSGSVWSLTEVIFVWNTDMKEEVQKLWAPVRCSSWLQVEERSLVASERSWVLSLCSPSLEWLRTDYQAGSAGCVCSVLLMLMFHCICLVNWSRFIQRSGVLSAQHAHSEKCCVSWANKIHLFLHFFLYLTQAVLMN